MSVNSAINSFLESSKFAVVGASADRSKYGNKVLRCYQMHGYEAVPVNPREKVIEGVECAPSVTALPVEVNSISVITPPQITEKVVEEAILKGIGNIWMQPGAESLKAIERCREAGINVIADGSCILVVLGYREH